MAAAQDGDDVELQHLEAQPVVSIRGIIPTADLAQHQGDRLRELAAFLRQRGVQSAGPPFVRYHTFGESETDVELGIPVVELLDGEGRVGGGVLPSGPAVTTWHIGAHDRLGDAYARLNAGVKAHGREPAGAAWEVYYWIDPGDERGASAWPEPARWRTQLVQPVTEPPTS